MPLQNATDTMSPQPTRKERAEKVLERHRALKAMKAPWLYTYQLLGEFIMTRKQDFTVHITPGMFLTGKIFDSTAPMANHFMASALLGALWPNGSRSFNIQPSQQLAEDTDDSEEIKEYFEFVTRVMSEVMDDPKAGLMMALEEYMYDQGAFGISGIHVKENQNPNADTPISYIAVDAKKITIAEGADGFVDTCYIEQVMTVRQVVQEYGLDEVSERTRDGFIKGNRQEDKVKVLHAIEPRIDGQIVGGFGNRNLPIASIHIEIDGGHILKESGYQKMPVFVTRFWKSMGEVYGRSPGMECMPDILEVNEMREASIVAVEKLLNPPLLVLSDGSLGGQTINTSAGAISVHNVSGRIANSSQKPVEPLITVGEMKDTYLEIERLQNIIKSNFFKDLLSDLNNEHRQTLGEANIRNQLRGQALGTIFSRQIAECFSRVVERTFDILFKQRRLGYMPGNPETEILQGMGQNIRVIPDAIAELIRNGQEAYKIRFVSPAARTMRAEELTGIQQSLTAIANLAGIVPDIMDNVDTDEAAELIIQLTGAPTSILHGSDVVAELRKQRAQVQQQQAAAAAKEQESLTAKHLGQAAAAGAKAGLPIQALFGQQEQAVML
jgi:hypothetical protein